MISIFRYGSLAFCSVNFLNLVMFSGEVKSVYVRNLPLTVSALEIEEEFMKFGRLKPDAVAIRNRKVHSFCFPYACTLAPLTWSTLICGLRSLMCRILVFAMRSLNLKIFLAFIMRSRYGSV